MKTIAEGTEGAAEKAYKPTYRLNNWTQWGPDEGGILRGQVVGNPKFVDGEVVTTSPLRGITNGVAETKNTFYVLGERFEYIPSGNKAD